MLLSGNGLVGEYFNEIDLTDLASTRTDAVVNFPSDSLGDSAQGQVIADDSYSIRWSGWVFVDHAATWTFTTISNDGVRLWVDDTSVIDNWELHTATRDDGSLELESGWHPIRLEYFQQGGSSDLRLLFSSSAGQSEVVIPASNLCTTDPNFGMPNASAGPDQILRLPDDSVTLVGSATDDGTIVDYQWLQISGPSAASLANDNAEAMNASNLVEGTYVFELTVTDDQSNTDSDTVAVQVIPEIAAGSISGELMQWHTVTIDFEGPQTSETAAFNPFTNYRLDVTFTGPSGQSFVVPGFYTADGNAAHTGATSGNLWRVRFAPDEIGTWIYSASFRTGSNVATSEAPNPGTGAGFFDGEVGFFEVSESDKTGDDFRAPNHGLIKNRGHHYLTYAGGDVFLKGGPDIPENFFGFDGFDNTPSAGHDFDQHVQDWNPGDPDWDDDDADSIADDGRGIIGALNYVAAEGGNVIYFLPMNVGGDGNDTYPTVGPQNKTQYDVSKLAQWELAMEHANSKGILLHFVLAETEFANENYHDSGNLGNQRKLYYRELIARFAHHAGIQFNIGEENDYGTAKREQFAAFLKSIDPYDHPVTTHTHGGQYDAFYNPLLGNNDFDITSFQGNNSRMDMAELIVDWRNRSAGSGTPLAISFDEPQKIENDKNDTVSGYPHGRRDKMWPVYMSGGAGFEWYVQQDGGGHSFDQQIDNYRNMDVALNWTGYAVDFLSSLPLLEMSPNHSLGDSASGNNTYVLAKPGDSYAMYNDRNGANWTLDLTGTSGAFRVQWFDPRNGGPMQTGAVSTVSGGGVVSLGSAPNSVNQDWAALVTREGPPGPNEPPHVSINSITALAPTTGGVFQEENGLVVFELESEPAVDGWQFQNSVTGHTGGGYFRWEGPNLFGNPGAQGVIEYKFNITNPGTYQMRFHNHRNGGIPFDQENDIWAKMDNGQWIKIFSSQQGTWNWQSNFDFGEGNRPSASYQLGAGEHTLTISGRSTGFRVDRVALYNLSLTTAGQAQNLSNPQSPVAGQTGELAFELEGVVLDDGQATITPQLQWSLESGPGTASFSAPQAATTSVEFSVPGEYLVKLTADDGEFVTSRTRTVIAPAVDPPTGETTFAPADDAYTEGSPGFNNDVIKVQPSGPVRNGYLKFSISDLTSEEILSAKLRLTVSQDPGSGTLNLYQGLTNGWTEESLNSSNAPAQGVLLDSVNGTFSTGQVVEFDVTSYVVDNGVYTFVLRHGGGNDVWFSTKEGAAAPELVIGSGGNADFNLDDSITGADFLAWQRGNGQPNALYYEGDANGDGSSDSTDLDIWRQSYALDESLAALNTDKNNISNDVSALLAWKENGGLSRPEDATLDVEQFTTGADFLSWQRQNQSLKEPLESDQTRLADRVFGEPLVPEKYEPLEDDLISIDAMWTEWP